MALDLFGRPHLPGLQQADDIITPIEEQALIGMIDASDLSPFKYQQWTGKRLTQSFGWSYDFQTGIFAPTTPIPGWLSSLKRRAAAFAGVPTDDLVQALLIRYEPGAGIGWHRDRPVFEHVVGISLGEPATMRFRKKEGSRFLRTNMPLNPRAIYHLSGEMRYEWEHSISEMEETRWSITFRSLRS
ncbi:2OG-Fe(II) oxygenase [Sphingobium cupriresistens LL01]|uniref:2OG-Fe(II) oxygenase n=1 Tax=Sphingobium cupriresistens LL01 TaxID=1420583 RepID=A0A0J8AVR9_9SPHN|nr:2OG-Fe(II) oxygenase [Sphingobium cupriresistens LL01]